MKEKVIMLNNDLYILILKKEELRDIYWSLYYEGETNTEDLQNEIVDKLIK